MVTVKAEALLDVVVDLACWSKRDTVDGQVDCKPALEGDALACALEAVAKLAEAEGNYELNTKALDIQLNNMSTGPMMGGGPVGVN